MAFLLGIVAKSLLGFKRRHEQLCSAQIFIAIAQSDRIFRYVT